jgi:hypothetical protein
VTSDDLHLTLTFEGDRKVVVFSEIGPYEAGGIYFGTFADDDQTPVLKLIVF